MKYSTDELAQHAARHLYQRMQNHMHVFGTYQEDGAQYEFEQVIRVRKIVKGEVVEESLGGPRDR